MEERPLAPDEVEASEVAAHATALDGNPSIDFEDLPEAHLHLENEDHQVARDSSGGEEDVAAHATTSSDRHSADRPDGELTVGDDDDGDDGLVFEGNKLGEANAGRKLSNLQLCGIALYWFARSAWWAAFPIFLLPLQVRACARVVCACVRVCGLSCVRVWLMRWRARRC